MLDRNIPPSVQSVSHIRFAQAESHQLANQVPVYLIRAGKHEIIRVELIFKSGRWYEPSHGISFFAAKMLLEGTPGYDADAISSFFDDMGAHVQIQPGPDHIHISIYVLKKNLEPTLAFFTQCILEANLPEHELANLKDIYTQQLSINQDKNTFLAGKAFRKLMFGEAHPYGHTLEKNDIERNIGRDSLEDYLHQRLLSGLEIIVSGPIDQNVIDALKHFEALPDLSAKSQSWSVTKTPMEQDILREKSLQTSIRLGRKMVGKNHPDYFSLVILNEILGGYFGSRLMKNIREEKGYTYGIYSTMVHHMHDHYWVIGADVKKEFRAEALREIFKEMKRLCLEPIEPGELEILRNYMLGSFLTSLETSFALADKFRRIHFFGLGYDHYDQYLQAIHEVDARILQEKACKYLDPDDFKRVLVG